MDPPTHPYAIHLYIHTVEASQTEAGAIGAIAGEHDFSGMVDGGVPAPQLLDLAQRVIAGRVAQARGDYQEAVTAFREAAAIQDDLLCLEPPYWDYPVRQSLGAALLQQGRPDEAELVFRSALEQFPNNAWALYGLREALKAQGNPSALAEIDRRLRSPRKRSEIRAPSTDRRPYGAHCWRCSHRCAASPRGAFP